MIKIPNVSKLEQQANILFDNVSGWETRSLERIAKRIKKCGKMSVADIQAINNAAVAKGEMDAIMKDLAEVTRLNISQLQSIYAQSLEEQHLANKPLYDYRGKKFDTIAENKAMTALVRSAAKTTGGTMLNLSTTKALCIFNSEIGKVTNLGKAIYSALDKATVAVTTGTADFNTAMRDTIKELGGSGIRVNYGGGVTRQLNSVVRQNLLWGAKQINTAYYEMIGDELGCDGIEIDYHSNPRPSHEFMQGMQYVIGKARTINGIHFESADKALKALQDYGCLHFKTPIICGVSEPRYSKEELRRLKEQDKKPIEIDGVSKTGYEWKQAMRRLESETRKEKLIRDMAKTSGDNILAKQCDAKIKAYREKYNQIADATGIKAQPNRMSITKGAK